MCAGNLKPRCCRVCDGVQDLERCSACQVVYYCSPNHRDIDISDHRNACHMTRMNRLFIEQAKRELRSVPGSGSFPPNIFETHMGRFGQFEEARVYLQTRTNYACTLLNNFEEDTPYDAVDVSLDTLLGVLHESRDNETARDLVPSLYLRLNRDQEAYDFLKWYATTGANPNHDLFDTSLSFLHIRGADMFEPLEPNWLTTGESRNMGFTSAVALIKLRICSSLIRIQKCSRGLRGVLPAEIINIIRGHLVSGTVICEHPKVLLGSIEDNSRLLLEQKRQLWQLIDSIDSECTIFWDVFVNPNAAYTQLQMEGDRMTPLLQRGFEAASLNIDAWAETPRSFVALDQMLKAIRKRRSGW